MKEQAEMRVVKEGKYIIIDEEPCQVVSTAHSKPGKHGSAKLRVEAIGIFDGQRRSMVAPVDTKIYIPIVERKTGQILSINGDMAQIMNMSDYSQFELRIPPDLQSKVSPGQEVFYLESMGKIKFDIRTG